MKPYIFKRSRRRDLAWIPEEIELEPFTGSFYQGVVNNMVALGRARNAETYERNEKQFLRFIRKKGEGKVRRWRLFSR